MRPHRRQPTRPRSPWDSPGKNTGVGYHLLLQCMKVKSESEVVQSCPTLSDPMDCSLPGSSVHGIFQARVLEGVPLPSPKRSLVFPILLFSSISLHWSLRKAFLSLLAILWNSAMIYIYIFPFLLCLSLLFFSQLFLSQGDQIIDGKFLLIVFQLIKWMVELEYHFLIVAIIHQILCAPW